VVLRPALRRAFLLENAMKPIHGEFAKLVGKILGRRWFNQQRQRAERKNNYSVEKEPASVQTSGDIPEFGKKQG